MPVTITGSNTPTAGGVTYGDGATYANTAAGTSGQVLLSNGASAPTWGTAGAATTATNLAGGSNGTIPYQSASGTTQMLAVGSSGQLLQSNGASAPTWVTASPAAMTLISTQTASNSASLSWTGLSGYNNYIIVLDGIAPSTTNAYLLFQVGTGAGPTYITTSYINNDLVVIGNGSPSNSLNSNTTGIIAIGGGQTIGVRSTSYVSGRVSLFNMTNSLLTNCEYAASYQDQVNNMFTLGLGNGNTSNTTAKTAIKILWTSGNIASGTASLYGITS